MKSAARVAWRTFYRWQLMPFPSRRGIYRSFVAWGLTRPNDAVFHDELANYTAYENNIVWC